MQLSKIKTIVPVVLGVLLSLNLHANFPLPPDAPRPMPVGSFKVKNIKGFEALNGRVLTVERAAYFDDLDFAVQNANGNPDFYFGIPLSSKGYRSHDTDYRTEKNIFGDCYLRFHAFTGSGETYRVLTLGHFAKAVRTGSYSDYSDLETIVTKLPDRDDKQVLLTVRNRKTKEVAASALLTAQGNTRGFFEIIREEKKIPWNHGFWNWQKKSK